MDFKNIFIIGSMGSGKTSIGKILAKNNHLSFLDTDHEIIRSCGYSIPDIFEKFGEEHFRNLETEQLRKMDAIENHIISTGGGIVLKDDNKKLMKSLGLIIFLDINISSQMDRVKNRKNRPLLNDKNLKDNLLSLKKIRDPIYKKISNYIIDVSGKERNQVINEIQKII
ncbi:MAG: shikimate kinase [Gammaproteobacteria bacterium]|jgi:shikimate kinase|tara:strand:- start:18 stop:524 length:507 start_codon:yes stop_codon:yes gene_type:complete